MVVITRILAFPKKGKTFIDSVRIYARGGAGGQGQPKYGGHGGRGGHVYVRGDKDATLKKVIQKHPEKRFIAGKGQNSRLERLLGKAGDDLEINVPLGIEVKSDHGRILGDINEDGDTVMVARGGPGGTPENNFIGTRGEPASVRLDLKLIADVGLVGFPNAGKSTFLSTISKAKPKIASYPFTTIQPQLGMMQYEDHRRITVADLPGLIEGAHVNVGMGHYFLKHVERTKLLLFVVDLQGFRLKHDQPLRSPVETILLLNQELELYRRDLLNKPAVLLLNKIDVEGADERLAQTLELWRKYSKNRMDIDKFFRPDRLVVFDDIMTISAKQQIGTEEVKTKLRKLLDHYADLEYQESRDLTELQEKIDAKLTEHHRGRPV